MCVCVCVIFCNTQTNAVHYIRKRWKGRERTHIIIYMVYFNTTDFFFVVKFISFSYTFIFFSFLFFCIYSFLILFRCYFGVVVALVWFIYFYHTLYDIEGTHKKRTKKYTQTYTFGLELSFGIEKHAFLF